jgi:hypothetical protein
MTTGYVAKLHDGEQTFEGFALGCARAFGYLMDMRDSANDAAIVAVKVISPRYAANLEIARSELKGATLEPMSYWESVADSLAASAAANHAAEVAKREAAAAKSRAIIARYEAMLAKVNAWQPPSSEHEGLKAFMTEQLTKSIEWDSPSPFTGGSVPPVTVLAKTAIQIRDETIARAQNDVDDCTRRLADESQEIAARNLWVAQLNASVR